MVKKRTVGKAATGVMANHADVKRYAVVVFIGLFICFWILVTQALDFRAAIVYIIMGFGSLLGYIIFEGMFKKK